MKERFEKWGVKLRSISQPLTMNKYMHVRHILRYRVIIWECILNKHTARISIDRHSETLYTVRTPKVGHFICDRKRFDILKG